jgi:hypothetical protein
MTSDTFLDAIGGKASLVSALGFLLIGIFQFRYSRHLAAFAAKLQQVGKRQEIEFAWLHTKRAEVIAQLYGKLVDMRDALLHLKTVKRVINELPLGPDESQARRDKAQRQAEDIEKKLVNLIN